MGLILGRRRFAVLTDILGDEDHLGDMDFKVAGTANGITSLQMDIKIAGITEEIMKVALARPRTAACTSSARWRRPDRARGELRRVRAAHRDMIKIPTDKIREVIGTGGKVIREIVEKTGAKIDIEDDGTVKIASPNAKAIEEGHQVDQVDRGRAEVGEIYEGKVVKVDRLRRLRELLRRQGRPRPRLQLANERVARPPTSSRKATRSRSSCSASTIAARSACR
jgi:polyribonucleotide nucleotidyltransferase